MTRKQFASANFASKSDASSMQKGNGIKRAAHSGEFVMVKASAKEHAIRKANIELRKAIAEIKRDVDKK